MKSDEDEDWSKEADVIGDLYIKKKKNCGICG